MRKIDYVIIFFCAFAAALCYIDSPFAAPCFIISSSIGLIDSIKHKTIAGAIINAIFLALNIANLLERVF